MLDSIPQIYLFIDEKENTGAAQQLGLQRKTEGIEVRCPPAAPTGDWDGREEKENRFDLGDQTVMDDLI